MPDLQNLANMPPSWWIPRIIGFVVVTLLLLAVRRRRESILHWLRRAIAVEATYFGVAILLSRVGRTGLESLLGGLVAGFLVNQMMPGRSRYIPASVRRRKIAEHELRTGKKFNPRKYELDHEVPFSRGGSHTTDNLRVVEKRRNRSKGAKAPWWDLLGR
jgi:HNH endonuclease